MLKVYEFTITLQGTGHNDEEAWRDAVEGFTLDPGCVPENPVVVEDDDSIIEEDPCTSCRKCGENICGNDIHTFQCYEPLED